MLQPRILTNAPWEISSINIDTYKHIKEKEKRLL